MFLKNDKISTSKMRMRKNEKKKNRKTEFLRLFYFSISNRNWNFEKKTNLFSKKKRNLSWLSKNFENENSKTSRLFWYNKKRKTKFKKNKNRISIDDRKFDDLKFNDLKSNDLKSNDLKFDDRKSNDLKSNDRKSDDLKFDWIIDVIKM